MRIDRNIAHSFFLVNPGMFIPYASVYTVSSSAASGLVWKCSLEGQHIFSITAAIGSWQSYDGLSRKVLSVRTGIVVGKGGIKTAHELFTTAHDETFRRVLGRRGGPD